MEKFTVHTASQGVELLCAELTEAGFDSFVIDDCGEFHEFLETSKEYWDYVDQALTDRMEGISQVHLYLETAQEADALQALLAALPERYPAAQFGSLAVTRQPVEEENWDTSWQKNYRPLPIGERLVVVPSWMSAENSRDRLPIYLNLGLTFGTGEHDSTRMCMETLEEILHGGESVADLGSGSGILSIAALRLGAKSAVGVDIDPAAEHISTENAALNGFGADRFRAYTGDVVKDAEFMERLAADGYELVCANIVAGVIVRLLPVVPRFLKNGGRFLCSGILTEKETEVREAMDAAGLRVEKVRRTEQWCCLLACRKEDENVIRD